MDVQHQGLGFFGTYIYFVYLPFVYTLQARYLVSHQPAMPYWYLVPVVLLNGEFIPNLVLFNMFSIFHAHVIGTSERYV